MARLPRLSFLLFLLLCAPLSPAGKMFNLDRCAMDVVCLKTLCRGEAISFKYFATDFYELADCDIILMIKKLNATRYKIDLHIKGFHTDEFDLSLGSLRVKLEKNTQTVEADENNFVVSYETITFNDKTIDVIIDANIQNMSVIKEKDYIYILYWKHERDRSRKSYPVTLDNRNENVIAEAIKNTLTCPLGIFSDLSVSDEYEVQPLDFSALELNCPPGFKLVVSLPNKPLKILESSIKCKNKKWQLDMDGNYFHDHDWAEYIKESKLDGPLTDKEVQFTIADKLSIGCARKICSLCLVEPPAFANCTDCEKAVVKKPSNELECAALTCNYPSTQIFTKFGKYAEADGKRLYHVNVDPVCRKGEHSKGARWYNDVNDELIKYISCYSIPAADNDKWYQNKNETGNQPPHQSGKVNRSRKPPKDLEPKGGVGNWLKNNWISSILVPIIIIGIIGGCIIFLVVMLRTKDEQDQLHRQEQRIEEEMRDGNCGSHARSVRTSVSNSRSDEALV